MIKSTCPFRGLNVTVGLQLPITTAPRDPVPPAFEGMAHTHMQTLLHIIVKTVYVCICKDMYHIKNGAWRTWGVSPCYQAYLRQESCVGFWLFSSCMYVYHMHAWCPQTSQESIGFPRVDITVGVVGRWTVHRQPGLQLRIGLEPWRPGGRWLPPSWDGRTHMRETEHRSYVRATRVLKHWTISSAPILYF